MNLNDVGADVGAFDAEPGQFALERMRRLAREMRLRFKAISDASTPTPRGGVTDCESGFRSIDQMDFTSFFTSIETAPEPHNRQA